MALAATSAHARLDLFGGEKIPYLVCIRTCANCACDRLPPQYAECYCQDQIPAEPLENSEEVLLQLKEKSNEVDESMTRMPYRECMQKCDYCTACTRMWPPESSTCACVMNSKSK